MSASTEVVYIASNPLCSDVATSGHGAREIYYKSIAVLITISSSPCLVNHSSLLLLLLVIILQPRRKEDPIHCLIHE